MKFRSVSQRSAALFIACTLLGVGVVYASSDTPTDGTVLLRSDGTAFIYRNSKYRYYRCINTVPRTNRPRTCDAKSVRVIVLEPRAWAEVCQVIENPDRVLAELRSRQGATTAVDEEIVRVQATIKTLDGQKQRALRLFTIAEADDSDVKRELARINKLHLQARSRLAELEGRRAVSAQFEPMAEKVKEYCALIRDRLDQLTFEQKREVLEVLQAEFTLEKDGQLRILLVLPTAADISLYNNVRHASACVSRNLAYLVELVSD